MAQKGSGLIRIKTKTKNKLRRSAKHPRDTFDSLIMDLFKDQERRRKEVFKHRAERLNKIGKRT